MAVNRPTLSVLQAAALEPAPPEPPWLIESLWMRTGVGLIGGAPKVCKSWLGLDLAVSLASASACLGRFRVPSPAPVLVYLAEDALPAVRARIEALCAHRALDLGALALFVIDTPCLQLDLDAHVEALAEALDTVQPRLLVLDPLVRLHRLDENSSHDMAGLLGTLRTLSRRFDTAIAIVHHTAKKRRAHPGQTLRGSGDLHAFSDCALYLTRTDDDLKLTVEHRAAPAPAPFALRLVSRPDATATHLEVIGAGPDPQPHRESSLPTRVLDQLKQAGQPMRRGALRDTLRVNNQRLGTALGELQQRGDIHHTHRGWALVSSHPQRTTPAAPREPDLFA